MTDPKTFYRTFDDLLKNIRHKKNHEGFLCSILEEVRNNFGEQLYIKRMWLFEKRGDEFVLVNKFGDSEKVRLKRLSVESDPVQEVIKNGSYVYDNKDFSIAPELHVNGGHVAPAAIIIRNPENNWLVLFTLRPGWVKEEIVFSLNAIRSALNSRLFADAFKTDLEHAAQIQKSMLPQRMPQVEGYDIVTYYQPTEVVGGDLYDFFEFEEDEVLGVCIGDASGHGLPAALLVRDCVIGLRMGIERQFKMVHSIKKLNSVIYRSTYSSRFISLFYGEIEKDGHLIYVNAGHPAPFLVSETEVKDLKATGLILGALPEINLQRSFAKIPLGGVLVLFSDGIFEHENRDEDLFGLERLKELVFKNRHNSAQEILDNIVETVAKFGHQSKWEDDVTLMVIKRHQTD